VRRLFDLLAPPALLLFAWAGARYWPSGPLSVDGVASFLTSALLGTLAGFRLAWSAFRWGRWRRGRDPEPPPPNPDDVVRPMLRFIGCSVGSMICAAVGFAFWALATAFIRGLQ
jgi:hypothetical protein